MGYETQLLVGHDTGQSYSSDGTFWMSYATVDLCKLGYTELDSLPWKNETPDIEQWYFFPICGDGDTPVTEDRYGTKPRPVPIDDVITALELNAERDEYRRLLWAIGLLKAMKENSHENLTVILWGY